MLSDTKKGLLGKFLMLLAAIFWGSAAVIQKNTMTNGVPMLFVLGFRFLITAILLSLIFFKSLKNVKKSTLFIGSILGLVTAAAYIIQTHALKIVTPGESSFISGTYCVMMPFLTWGIYKKRPTVFNVIAGILTLGGIGFISFYDGTSFNVGVGEMMTFVCAIFFAIQVMLTDKYSKEEDPFALITVEMFVIGIICTLGTLFFEVGREEININWINLLGLLYMMLFSTLFAQTFQIVGLRYSNANQGSLILALQAVFGLLFSVIFGGEEQFNIFTYLGFGLIFLGILISETQLSFITKLFKKKEET